MNVEPRTVTVARRVVAALDDQQREALRAWAGHLLEIRASSMARTERARAAISATVTRDKVVPIVSAIAKGTKNQLWTQRSWAARLGLGAAAATAATLGGQGAGIAAMGGAIGVPLWIVFGAGASFAGVLIDEVERHKLGADQPDNASTGTSLEIIAEADWAFADEAEEEILNALPRPQVGEEPK
jgi:hypothetical protein